MLVKKIAINMFACIDALAKADADRRFVRKFDTRIRKIENVSSKTHEIYDQFVKEGGHYSKNPFKRLVSFYKSWNENRKKYSKNKSYFL